MQHWHLHLKYFKTLRDVFWMKLPWVISWAAVSWAAAGPRLLMWCCVFLQTRAFLAFLAIINNGNNYQKAEICCKWAKKKKGDPCCECGQQDMTRNATGCRYHLDLQQEWLPTAPHTLFWPDCHLFSEISYFIFSYQVSKPRSSEHLVSSELRSYRQLTPFSSSNCRLYLTPHLTAPLCCRAARWVLLLTGEALIMIFNILCG